MVYILFFCRQKSTVYEFICYLNKWLIVFFPVNKHHSIDGVNIKTLNYRPGKHEMDMQTF